MINVIMPIILNKIWNGAIPLINNNTPNNQMPIVLVGNKCDCKEKERTVKPEEMENIANEYGVCYFETSALTNKNINECFSCLCELIVKKKQITELYPEKKEQFMLEDGMKKNNDTNNKQNNGNNGKCCKWFYLVCINILVFESSIICKLILFKH